MVILRNSGLLAYICEHDNASSEVRTANGKSTGVDVGQHTLGGASRTAATLCDRDVCCYRPTATALWEVLQRG